MRFVIGSGVGISRTIVNNIREQHQQYSYTWNTALQGFKESEIINTDQEYKAKPETSFSYILYLATEHKIGYQTFLSFDFHYTLSHYKYSARHPKMEGYWVGLTFGQRF